MPSRRRSSRCAGSSRRARSAAWIFVWSVFTRPPRSDGWPVTSSTERDVMPSAASGRALLGDRGVHRRERRARRLHVLDVPSAARGRMGARAPASGLFSEGRTQEEAAPLIASWLAPRDVEAFVARLSPKLGPL